LALLLFVYLAIFAKPLQESKPLWSNQS